MCRKKRKAAKHVDNSPCRDHIGNNQGSEPPQTGTEHGYSSVALCVVSAPDMHVVDSATVDTAFTMLRQQSGLPIREAQESEEPITESGIRLGDPKRGPAAREGAV